MRITFIGDIIISQRQLPLFQTDHGYDFSVLKNSLENAFSDSDYVIANLETPIAGEEFGFTEEEYSYNTPEALLETLKSAGIDMVQTSNNHCLDRGTDGLKHTIDNISDYGLEYIGTHKKKEDAFKIIDIQGLRVGMMAYTYGTNSFANGIYLNKDNEYLVDLLQKQELSGSFERVLYKSDNRIIRRIKRFMAAVNPDRYGTPVYERREPDKNQRQYLKEQIKKCKASGAEFVIVLLHIGGQFNSVPSDYTKQMCNYCRDNGADLVVANHEHVIHPYDKAQVPSGNLCWYSLGNFLSDDGVLTPPYYKLCQYSVALSVDLEREGSGVRSDYCIQLFCNHTNQSNQVITEPVLDYYRNSEDHELRKQIKKDCSTLLNMIYGTESVDYDMCPFYSIGCQGSSL